MSNDLQVKMRIETVKERMVELIQALSSEQKRGDIKSPSELQHRVYHALQSFYESIGKETFKQIPAWGPPYSSDHNQMVEQILYDLSNLYGEIIRLTNDTQVNFEQVESERQSFLKQIAEIETTAKNIDAKVQNDSDVMVFRDDFSSVDKYDKKAVVGTQAYLAANEGLLTIHRIKSQDYNKQAKITIIKGNGLPGNTHIAHSVGSSVKFDGEENLHINLADILDGNSDTWFEFELFKIPEHTERLTEKKDFGYKEAVDWINQDVQSLRCVIQIHFDEPRPLNWASITPYIPNDRGALPAKIEKVVIDDGKGTMKGMGFEELFDGSKAFIFPKQDCKEITVYLRQDTSYPVTVGHFYFKQISTLTTTAGDEPHTHHGVRVYGDIPSIENLGVSYDTGKKEILYPIVKFDDKIKNEAYKQNELFVPSSLSATGETVMSGVEIVPGFRYMIGIRDLVLSSIRFEKMSTYISTPYYSQKAVKEILLRSDFTVPEEFGEGDWLTFYLSVDNGKNWHEIHHQDIYKEGKKTKYMINSNVPKEGRLEEIGYIDTPDPVHEIRVKIVMERPVEGSTEFFTPVVYEYEVNAKTE